MASLKERIKTELDEIMLAHGGLLNPSHVVEHARDPDTTLHSQFVWDNSEAADKFRLWQARQIISNYHVVCTTPKGQVVQVSAYVSLPEDRKSGGGYRAIGEVLSMPEHRRQLFAQAMAEFKQWRAKYSSLMRLQPVFKAFDAMRARTERSKARAHGKSEDDRTALARAPVRRRIEAPAWTGGHRRGGQPLDPVTPAPLQADKRSKT